MLNQRASQFRAIQRRLLTRFKDKTPSPLANLDTLLEGTYRQVCNTSAAKILPNNPPKINIDDFFHQIDLHTGISCMKKRNVLQDI